MMMRKTSLLALLAALFLIFIHGRGAAAQEPATEAQAQAAGSQAEVPPPAAAAQPDAATNVATLNPGLGPAPATVKRDTPRLTVFGYIDACRDGRYEDAAHYLYLDRTVQGQQEKQGSKLARRFKFVLDQTLWVDRDAVSDEAGGHPEDDLPPEQDQIGSVALGGGQQSIRLERFRLEGGETAWLFAPNTIDAIDALYDIYGVGWFGDRLPPRLFSLRVGDIPVWQLVGVVLFLLLAYLGGRLLTPAVTSLVMSTAERTKADWDDELAKILPRPLRLFFTAALFGLAAHTLRLPVPAQNLVDIFVRTTVLVGLGLFAQGTVGIVAAELQRYLSTGYTDPQRRQGVATQVSVIQRILAGSVVIVIVALILAQFQVVRTVGLSLLASAGIAGIAIGFAAQRSVANLFAGIQIMLTQPIRINDVVIVEGEWGNIEEITFTHVVVKIWDLRRLVVPISYFLEKPFQNWTLPSPELLGTIYFYTDHTIDLGAMRAELDRILGETDLWDGKVKGVIITGTKDHVVEVRALISAKDSSDQWNLRCLVREKLVAWLQAQGKALPRLRIDAPEPGGPVQLPHVAD